MNTIIIRKETPEDYNWVIELTEKAFETMEFSDGNEGKLVEKLRKAPTFIPELSLVAELGGQLVGHILFTPLQIRNEQNSFTSLVLGPVSVLPEYQKQGIGEKLIRTGHQKAFELGFQSVILIGYPEYYPRFGYKPASGWGIKTQIPLPSDDVFMAVELTEGGLTGVSGMAVFPPEFG
ncbi:MAG: N-acetyltransferase [Bacteroidota bacterium]|nr:GNAT family N-acetyltransferase [Odoribacter sp.]MDP3641687.1 N-acetyltransferase [Bacteroidota bacterium]